MQPIEQLESRRFLSAGDLITSFGTDGIAMLGAESRSVDRTVVQSDRRIVVAGAARGGVGRSDAVALWRFNRNGSLDRGFGDGGIVRTDLSATDDEKVRGIALDGLGRIIVAGETSSPGTDNDGIFVARYLSSGSIDHSFGDHGRVLTKQINYRGGSGYREMPVHPFADGSTAFAVANSTPLSVVVAKLDVNGSFDTSFGVAGVSRFSVTIYDSLHDLWENSDGTLKLASANYLTTLEADGAVRTITRNYGFPLLATDDYVQSLSRLSDGRVAALVWHESSNINETGAYLRMLNADDTPDSAFGSGTGFVYYGFRGTYDASPASYHLSSQPNDQLVLDLGGAYGANTNWEHQRVFQRLNANGTPDLILSPDNGEVALPEIVVDGNHAATASDGKLVMAYTEQPNAQVRLARLTPSLQLDTTFSADGIAEVAPARSITGKFSAVAYQSDGKIIAAGTTYGEQHPMIARFNADGSPDLSFNSIGSRIIGGTDDRVQVSAVHVLSDGRILLASNRGIFRFLSDGSRDLTFGTSRGRLNRPVNSFHVYPDGRITAAGERGEVLNISADGRRVRAFAVLSDEQYSNYFTVRAIVPMPDGKMLVGGDIYFDDHEVHTWPAIVRLNADGTRDRSFDRDGMVTIEQEPGVWYSNRYVNSLAIRPNGKIVALVRHAHAPVGLVQLNPNGAIDPTFGDAIGGGIRFPDWYSATFDGVAPQADMILRPDGRVLLASQTDVDNWDRASITQIGANASPDSSFGSNGVLLAPTSIHGDYPCKFFNAILQTPSGDLLAVGLQWSSSPFFALLDLG